MRPWLALLPLLAAACGLAAPAAPNEATEAPTQVTPAEPVAAGSAAEANRAFGLALYRELAAKPGNVVISPVSIAGAFGPVAAGAQGETRAAIGNVLHFPSEESRLHSEVGGMLRALESNTEGARVSIANALWVMQGFPVKPAFLAVAKKSYDAEIENLDFRNSQVAADRINGWVTQETNGRIKKLISPGALNARTALVVTNAVHFLGDWREAFPVSATRPEPFHLADGSTRQVPLMYGQRRIRYAESDTVQMIDLPYKGDRLSMTLVLPKQRGGLAAVEAGLSDEQLGEWLRSLDLASAREVRVHFPKLETEASYQLVRPLADLGMGTAFDPERANFRGISDADLFISDVVHKTYLRIDEKGTEAAAATGVVIQVTSAGPEPATFRADHPFLFLIRDKQTGAVLFLGRIANPVQ